jgi:hypothetical protein
MCLMLVVALEEGTRGEGCLKGGTRLWKMYSGGGGLRDYDHVLHQRLILCGTQALGSNIATL